MSSSSRNRDSISKQRGDEMSSRLIPPKPGASAFTVRTISSGSVVSRQIGQASMWPNSLKSIALPSITGRAASGPISPRPSTAVLGLGDIGPEAALPVMEGKAMLFKEFGHIDAWPICLDTTDPDEIVRTVKALAPGFGGINLEDISSPRCFEIESRLREELDIPVFHDDQD